MRYLVLIFFIVLKLNAILVSSNDTPINLLKYSKIYHDLGSKETIQTIIKKQKDFTSSKKDFIDYSNLVDESVWIKFDLENNSNIPLNKALVIDNILTETIELYEIKDGKTQLLQTTGMFHRKKFDGTINFNLSIVLEPNSSHSFYLRVQDIQLSLWFKPMLYNQSEFYKYDTNKQLIWALFFGGILSLIIYNIFLFIFTKDSIYFYYSLYLVATLMQNEFALYAKFHIFPMDDAEFVKKDFYFSIYYINFLVTFAMALFIRSFLQTKQYPKIDFSLKTLIVIITIYYILETTFNIFPLELVVLFLFFTPYYFLWIGFYALNKKNPHAKFFLIGWSFALLGWLSLFFQHMGIIPVRYIYSYTFETLIITECILFAIFLAYRIRNLEKKKNDLTKTLLKKQKDESKRLEKTVKFRTQELDNELRQNELLLKELHHRVKNNMQLITSLYALKLNENNDKKMKEKLEDVERKIHAMSIVHQMLFTQKDLEIIDAKEYFEKIVENIAQSLEMKNINFNLNISAILDIEEAIYCGLIVNELVTNAIKYAFDGEDGIISISLNNYKNRILLEVSDNGKGMQHSDIPSFGQMMVESLAEEQLEGKLDIKTDQGTHISLWFENKIKKSNDESNDS